MKYLPFTLLIVHIFLDGKSAMKAGVGEFNKQASEQYKSLSRSDRDRLASLSSTTATSDAKSTAGKIFNVVHKKVCSSKFSFLY